MESGYCIASDGVHRTNGLACYDNEFRSSAGAARTWSLPLMKNGPACLLLQFFYDSSP